MQELNKDKQQGSEGEVSSEFITPTSFLLKFRTLLIVLVHILVFALSLMLSFLLAYNMRFEREWLVGKYPLLLLFFVIIKLIIFGLFRQYRGWWRYVGISEITEILRAALVSTVVILVLWYATVLQIDAVRRYLEAVAGIAQSVFLLDMALTFLLLAGVRMGAGDAGEALLREIHRMPVAEYDVIGLIDDEPAKQKIKIHGIPVLGIVEQLSQVCKEQNIEEIAIAMPSATHQQLRRVIQVCEGTKIRFRTVPSLADIASGKFRVSQIRDVDINDLLGREAVELDLNLIEAFLKGKTILVTGAGGSIGSEMCRQICQFEPALLLLIEQAENPLFYIEKELNSKFGDIPIKAVICDIADNERVEGIFQKYKPQVVIHAAAHKHVPLMELNPGEAVKNNTLGTKIVADAADRFGSSNFVMISTDKAVNPTSIMGSTKRIAEMYIQDLNKSSDTYFVTVRFGNVLGSEGSVIPIFKKQIAEGGPVTVTHPEMKRYFMTIPEASQLVLQAATMGKGGEIFVLDMGEPVKIVDLARELITLSGFRPGEDIEVLYTGIRPGEKLFEELSIKGEDMKLTRHPKISIWENIPAVREKLYAGIEELAELAKSGEHKRIVEKIKELVPEYRGEN